MKLHFTNRFILSVFLPLGLITLVHAADKTTTKYANEYDFSALLKPKTKFLGFIDPNFRRLKINFESVAKNKSNPFTYLIEGSSTVGTNTCKFIGTIDIQKIKKLSKMHYGVDDEFKGAGIQFQGELSANYIFKEEKKSKLCGEFKGKMTLYWYSDKNGKIRCDDIEDYSDNYKNNQYQGKWTAYGETRSKNANWGEYRIPNSGDLDIGAAEFGPDPKYKNQGWDDF